MVQLVVISLIIGVGKEWQVIASYVRFWNFKELNG